jgi:hypothetical protein
MRILLVGVVCVMLSACGRNSSPTAPTSANQTVESAGLALPGDPNHFDPDPIRGFETTKWHDLNYKTQKYEFGRALYGQEVNFENLKRTAEKYGFLYLGQDLIAVPGGEVIDCIYDLGGPKQRWQWQLSH